MNCPSDLSEGRACQVRLYRRDVLVGSVHCRLVIHPSSPGTYRGLKSRAESGAKAPHSICGAGHDKRAPPALRWDLPVGSTWGDDRLADVWSVRNLQRRQAFAFR